MNVLDRVRRTIQRHGLAARDTRVLAAVSGGSDSVALAHVLRELDDAGELRLIGIAHFNHQLRDSAGRDEAFSAGVAARVERPFLTGRDDVRARAATEKCSIEVAGRRARLAFLESARERSGADVVALGHTRDDQAETFLLRLIRGAGARGLAAMHPRNGSLIRPLLECRRDELRRSLEARHVTFVDDESNADRAIPRNRVRAELLPLLADRFNPSAVDALADAAEIAREEWAWLEQETAAWMDGAVRNQALTWTIDASRLREAPVPIARMVIRRAMEAAAHGRPIAFADVAQVLDLVRFGGPSFDAPGQKVKRIGTAVVLQGRPADVSGRPTGEGATRSFRREPLSIPGEVEFRELGCSLSAEPGPPRYCADPGNLAQAVIRRDRCIGQLAVRFRRDGDRFRPVGLGGRKKLQDFFVDRKVERGERDRVPLVVDAADRIIWVAGHAIDEEFRVTDPAQAVLILRLKGLGGSV